MSRHNRSKTPPAHQYYFTNEIAQMMYVFGEVREPDGNTVRYIEDVLKEQLSQIITAARRNANRRASRAINSEDVLFIVRHDVHKMNRLKSFLSFKDYKDRAAFRLLPNLPNDFDETDDKVVQDMDTIREPSLHAQSAEDLYRSYLPTYHRYITKMPWELSHTYTCTLADPTDEIGEDELKVEPEEQDKSHILELDELTQNMTSEQYDYYAECRRASITFPNRKLFKEFVNMHSLAHTDVGDDIVDMLGYLSYEIVQSICKMSLTIKAKNEGVFVVPAKRGLPTDAETAEYASRAGKLQRVLSKAEDTDEAQLPTGPFSKPANPDGSAGASKMPSRALPGPAAVLSDSPIRPHEVSDAMRLLQKRGPKAKAYGFQNWNGSVRKPRPPTVLSAL